MTQEINVYGGISCFKPTVMSRAFSRDVANLVVNMAGNFVVWGTFTAATSATVVPLDSVTSPHYSFWLNTDTTNYVQLFNGASGAVLVRLQAGEFAVVPLDPTAVPYAKANTAACIVEYAIFSL